MNQKIDTNLRCLANVRIHNIIIAIVVICLEIVKVHSRFDGIFCRQLGFIRCQFLAFKLEQCFFRWLVVTIQMITAECDIALKEFLGIAYVIAIT